MTPFHIFPIFTLSSLHIQASRVGSPHWIIAVLVARWAEVFPGDLPPGPAPVSCHSVRLRPFLMSGNDSQLHKQQPHFFPTRAQANFFFKNKQKQVGIGRVTLGKSKSLVLCPKSSTVSATHSLCAAPNLPGPTWTWLPIKTSPGLCLLSSFLKAVITTNLKNKGLLESLSDTFAFLKEIIP